MPLKPCLVAVSDSWLTAGRYMLGIDEVILCDDIPTFLLGLGMLFAAYYNFNIRYPLEVAGLLEFIQRCFVGINPDRGSKIRWWCTSKSPVSY
ncbi:hypothetical protein Pmani_010658 [Petrolisthes manimaculis]|uniref:Uncharacterized protein n=1 Tax=Petrolisthes manimaculis TaxID=1843537 RepID=A0AAE1Q127_9EUCA|nr:hypothetical protein Pmani_014642 [Petrolisthes manimaculis]KAK4318360.1 hypothetical protein Pmani_010658 [Petrolisthes manimaculis]